MFSLSNLSYSIVILEHIPGPGPETQEWISLATPLHCCEHLGRPSHQKEYILYMHRARVLRLEVDYPVTSSERVERRSIAGVTTELEGEQSRVTVTAALEPFCTKRTRDEL